MRATSTPGPFGGYAHGWHGVTLSGHYLVECLIQEFHRQEDTLVLLLQGTFGQALRADHTRKVARKVVLASSTMSSYAVMNENWMILSWVMLQTEGDRSLQPMYEGLSCRRTSADIPKAKYQWVDRDCCAAFKISNPGPQEHLHWDCWKTTEDLLAEATLGALHNTSASLSKFNSFIVCNASPEIVCQSTIHCTILSRLLEAQWVTVRVELPAVFDPALIWELNAACQRVTGVPKYPTLHISNRDTGERFGLTLQTQHNTSAAVTVETQLHSSAQDEVHDISAAVAGTDSQETSDGTAQYNPVGAVPILHFQPPIPASATAKEESHPLMDTVMTLFLVIRPCPCCLCRDSRPSPNPQKDDVFLRPGEQLPALKMALRSSGSGARLLSLTEILSPATEDKGMAKELTWMEYQQSDFFEAERDRWVSEKS
ncbi:unnamed protein product [Arctogadus glacialis]